MAMHTDLAIYKASIDLFILAVGLTQNIPRGLKQVISQRVMDDCMDILTLIGRANSNTDKRPHLIFPSRRVACESSTADAAR